MEPQAEQTAFEQAASASSRGMVREYVDLLRYNKKYWLAPIIVVLLVIGAVLVLGGTAAAPLIYAIF